MFQTFCKHNFFSFAGFFNMEEIVNKNNNPQRCIWCSFYLWRKRAKELSGYNPMFGNSDTWQARSIQIYSWCNQWSCNLRSTWHIQIFLENSFQSAETLNTPFRVALSGRAIHKVTCGWVSLLNVLPILQYTEWKHM